MPQAAAMSWNSEQEFASAVLCPRQLQSRGMRISKHYNIAIRSSRIEQTNLALLAEVVERAEGARAHSSCLHSSSSMWTCSREQGMQKAALQKL